MKVPLPPPSVLCSHLPPSQSLPQPSPPTSSALCRLLSPALLAARDLPGSVTPLALGPSICASRAVPIACLRGMLTFLARLAFPLYLRKVPDRWPATYLTLNLRFPRKFAMSSSRKCARKSESSCAAACASLMRLLVLPYLHREPICMPLLGLLRLHCEESFVVISYVRHTDVPRMLWDAPETGRAHLVLPVH